MNVIYFILIFLLCLLIIDRSNSNELFWYQGGDNKIYGPFDFNQLQQWLQKGLLPSNLLVSRNNEGPFVPLPHLFNNIQQQGQQQRQQQRQYKSPSNQYSNTQNLGTSASQISNVFKTKLFAFKETASTSMNSYMSSSTEKLQTMKEKFSDFNMRKPSLPSFSMKMKVPNIGFKYKFGKKQENYDQQSYPDSGSSDASSLSNDEWGSVNTGDEDWMSTSPVSVPTANSNHLEEDFPTNTDESWKSQVDVPSNLLSAEREANAMELLENERNNNTINNNYDPLDEVEQQYLDNESKKQKSQGKKVKNKAGKIPVSALGDLSSDEWGDVQTGRSRSFASGMSFFSSSSRSRSADVENEWDNILATGVHRRSRGVLNLPRNLNLEFGSLMLRPIKGFLSLPRRFASGVKGGLNMMIPQSLTLLLPNEIQDISILTYEGLSSLMGVFANITGVLSLYLLSTAIMHDLTAYSSDRSTSRFGDTFDSSSSDVNVGVEARENESWKELGVLSKQLLILIQGKVTKFILSLSKYLSSTAASENEDDEATTLTSLLMLWWSSLHHSITSLLVSNPLFSFTQKGEDLLANITLIPSLFSTKPYLCAAFVITLLWAAVNVIVVPGIQRFALNKRKKRIAGTLGENTDNSIDSIGRSNHHHAMATLSQQLSASVMKGFAITTLTVFSAKVIWEQSHTLVALPLLLLSFMCIVDMYIGYFRFNRRVFTSTTKGYLQAYNANIIVDPVSQSQSHGDSNDYIDRLTYLEGISQAIQEGRGNKLSVDDKAIGEALDMFQFHNPLRDWSQHCFRQNAAASHVHTDHIEEGDDYRNNRQIFNVLLKSFQQLPRKVFNVLYNLLLSDLSLRLVSLLVMGLAVSVVAFQVSELDQSSFEIPLLRYLYDTNAWESLATLYRGQLDILENSWSVAFTASSSEMSHLSAVLIRFRHSLLKPLLTALITIIDLISSSFTSAFTNSSFTSNEIRKYICNNVVHLGLPLLLWTWYSQIGNIFRNMWLAYTSLSTASMSSTYTKKNMPKKQHSSIKRYTSNGWSSVAPAILLGLQMQDISVGSLNNVNVQFPTGKITTIIGGTTSDRLALLRLVESHNRRRYLTSLEGTEPSEIRAGPSCRSGRLSLHGRDLNDWDSQTVQNMIISNVAASQGSRLLPIPAEILAGMTWRQYNNRQELTYSVLKKTGASTILQRYAGHPIESAVDLDDTEWGSLSLSRAILGAIGKDINSFESDGNNRCSLLLLHAPTEHLSDEEEEGFFSLLEECGLPEANQIVVLTSSKLETALRSDHVVVLGSNTVVEAGSSTDLLSNPETILSQRLNIKATNSKFI